MNSGIPTSRVPPGGGVKRLTSDFSPSNSMLRNATERFWQEIRKERGLVARPGCIWNGYARMYMDLREVELVAVDLIHMN
jgi:hypothetical protein